MLSVLSMGYFGSCIGIAAATDIARYKIFNWTWICLAAGFFPAAIFAGMPVEQIGTHGLAFALMMAVAFGLFYMKMFGAGDGKLIAAVALWVGFEQLLPFLIYSSLAGGVLAILLIVIRRYPRPLFLYRFSWSDAIFDKRNGMPYGVAIAIGALLVYPEIYWL